MPPEDQGAGPLCQAHPGSHPDVGEGRSQEAGGAPAPPGNARPGEVAAEGAPRKRACNPNLLKSSKHTCACAQPTGSSWPPTSRPARPAPDLSGGPRWAPGPTLSRPDHMPGSLLGAHRCTNSHVSPPVAPRNSKAHSDWAGRGHVTALSQRRGWWTTSSDWLSPCHMVRPAAGVDPRLGFPGRGGGPRRENRISETPRAGSPAPQAAGYP